MSVDLIFVKNVPLEIHIRFQALFSVKSQLLLVQAKNLNFKQYWMLDVGLIVLI